jgi:hypothetical protein
MACGADLIATRNHEDYAGAPILAAAPGEGLKILPEGGQARRIWVNRSSTSGSRPGSER